VLIEDGVEIDDCIIMDYSILRQGVRLRGVIVDRYNTIEAGQRIGFDAHADGRRFAVSYAGIVVIPRGQGQDTRADGAMFRYL